MVYYVAYRTSGSLEDKCSLANQLKALGCRQIRCCFWEVRKGTITATAKLLHKNSPIFLKRIRELRKPTFTGEKEYSDLGSLVVVACNIPENEKSKVKNLLKKAPCLRFCHGVYAFSQRRNCLDLDKRLIGANSLWEFMRQLDREAVIVSRVVIVNNQANVRLLEETKSRVEREVYNIIEGYKILFKKIKNGNLDRQETVRISRRLRRRFVTVKKIGALYAEWLKLDLSNMLIRPYPAVRKVRSLLEEKFGSIK